MQGEYKNKRILITGGSGFIGGRLAERLRCQSQEVHLLDLKPPEKPDGFFHKGDLSDAPEVRKTVEKIEPDIVFHLAASLERKCDITSIKRSIDVNLGGMINLFAVLTELKTVPSLVVSGTAEEYGHNKTPYNEKMRENPVSAYSFSKVTATALCQMMHGLYGYPVAVLRPTVAYGPGQRGNMFIPALIGSLKENKKFEMTKGEQTRDFIYVEDLIDAYVSCAASRKMNGQIYNIGSGKPYSIREIAEKIGDLMGKKGLIHFGGVEYRRSEIMSYYVDCSKAGEELGWKPKTSIDEGLRRTIGSF
jgi:UDP-glucose 4-epimerase